MMGGVSRAAKGADCKSAGLRLRRFESYLPHQLEIAREFGKRPPQKRSLLLRNRSQPLPSNINGLQGVKISHSNMMVTRIAHSLFSGPSPRPAGFRRISGLARATA